MAIFLGGETFLCPENFRIWDMIIEQKVIDLITEHATFNETDYQPEDSTETAALNLFIAGSPDEIPEAKYDGGEQEKLPTGPGRS